MDPSSWPTFLFNHSGLRNTTNNAILQMNSPEDVASSVPLGNASNIFLSSSAIGAPYSLSSSVIPNADFSDVASQNISKSTFTDNFTQNNDFLRSKQVVGSSNSWQQHVTSSSPFGILPHQSILNSISSEEGVLGSVSSTAPVCHSNLNHSLCGGLMGSISLLNNACMSNSDTSVGANLALSVKQKNEDSFSSKISLCPNSEMNSFISQSNMNVSAPISSTSEPLLNLHENSIKASISKHNVGSLLSNVDNSYDIRCSQVSEKDLICSIPHASDKPSGDATSKTVVKVDKSLNQHMHDNMSNLPFCSHASYSGSSSNLNLIRPGRNEPVSSLYINSLGTESNNRTPMSSTFWDSNSVLESYMEMAETNSVSCNSFGDLNKSTGMLNINKSDSNMGLSYSSNFTRNSDFNHSENVSEDCNTSAIPRPNLMLQGHKPEDQINKSDGIPMENVLNSDVHSYNSYSQTLPTEVKKLSDTESRTCHDLSLCQQPSHSDVPLSVQSCVDQKSVDRTYNHRSDSPETIEKENIILNNATGNLDPAINSSSKMEKSDTPHDLNELNNPGEKNNKIIVPDISEDFGFLDDLSSPCNVASKPSENPKNSEYLSNFLKFLKTDSTTDVTKSSANDGKIIMPCIHSPSVSSDVKYDSHESPFMYNQKTRYKQVAKVSPLKHYQDDNEGETLASPRPIINKRRSGRGRNVSNRVVKAHHNLSDDEEDIYIPVKSRRKRGRRPGSTNSGRGRGRKRKINGNYISPSHELERHDAAHKSQNKILSSISNFDSLQITSLCFGDEIFKAGDFVVLANDFIDCNIPFLWRICAEGVIQKFEPFMEGGQLYYRSTTNFTEWTTSIQSKFLPLEIDYISSSDLSVIVSFPRDCKGRPIHIKGLSYSIQRTCYLHENFEIYIQTLISQALDSNFLTEVFQEKDEYFVESVEKIDSVCSGKCKDLLNTACWSKDFQDAVEIWPCLNVINNEDNKEICDACSKPGVKELIQMFGQTYNSMTLQNCAPSLAYTRKTFKICLKCNDLLIAYSLLVHQKYNFYTKCASCVTMKKQEDPRKDTTLILNELLADDAWLNKLFREAQTLWARVELILNKYNQNA